MKSNSVIHGDGLDLLRSLPAESVDMIFADLPYGVTECEWDKPIDLDQFWAAATHAAKPNAAIVMTTQQPFTSKVILSNLSMYRCEWIWTDGRPTGAFNSTVHPLRVHESVLVFSREKVRYFPKIWDSGIRKSSPGGDGAPVYSPRTHRAPYKSEGTRYPTTLLHIAMPAAERGKHPTQKPLELLDYLITTYTLPDELVADPCIGSGVAMVAAKRAGRRFIGADIESPFVEGALKWLEEPFMSKLIGVGL